MPRVLGSIILALTLVSCGADRRTVKIPGGDGGSGGTVDTESTGGSVGGTGMGGTGGGSSGGTGGGSSGSSGTSGSGATGGGDASTTQPDAEPMTMADGSSSEAGPSDGAVDPGGETLAGKPWIHLCPKSYNQEQCCMFLCSCLNTICSDSPADKPGIANCMPNCMKLNNMLMRCHVYHCYESTNPNVPGDHASHCGHASGRVGGGGCPTAVYQ
jgi:hypothetical protein